RDDGGQLRVFADVEQRMPRANLAIFGHVASRLPHEPYGRTVHSLAPARAKKPIFHWTGSYYKDRTERSYALSRLRASASKSSSQSGLNRTSAPSPRSSRDTASSRK